jgi:hypothetical protein
MCSCDTETCDVWDVVHPKARKAYRCDECYRDCIQPGDVYQRIGSLYDGSWATYRICLRCERLREAHNAADREVNEWDQCNPPIEGLAECIGENARESAEYLAAFRKAWRESAERAA